jgi:AraC-like DNA-binding protein
MRFDPADSLNWDQVPDRHTFYAVFWITEGAGEHYIDFKAYPIRPNSLFLMRPGQTHFFKVTQEIHGYNFFFKEDWLHLDAVSLQASRLFYLVEQHPAFYPLPQQAEALTLLLSQIYDEFNAARLGKSDALQSLFVLLLINLQRIYSHATTADKTEAENRLSSEFYYLVGQHFAESHRLAEYAAKLGVSTGYLNRKVTAAMGIPAAQFIRQRILIEAKRLLVHTDLSATEIAHQLGFTDGSYFGRFFKRETNLSPIHFRKIWYEKDQNKTSKSQ